MKKIAFLVLFFASLHFPQFVFAAYHPLTRVVDDPASGVTYIDLVVAIDWDINSPPSVAINGVDTPLDKAYIRGVMDSASDLLYTMTEGGLRLGKISVYSNRFLDNADILIFNKDGRANANINGFNVNGARNEMFTVGFGTAYTPFGLGQVIAHEFGHYMLGMFDEYREVGQMDVSSLGRPQDRDTARDTIMHDQSQFNSLSTPGDYADPMQRQTSHYRVYEKSAWETLISDPKNDTFTISQGYPLRAWFTPFKNKVLPVTLTKPTDTEASRASMQMTYMGGDRTVIVVDLGVQQQVLNDFIKAAQSSVGAIAGGSQVAVVTVSGAEFATPVSLTTLGNGATDPAREAVKNALAALQPVSSSAGGMDSALREAANIASPLAAAQDAANKNGTPVPLSNTVEIPQTPVIILFSTVSATPASQSTSQAISQGGIMLNPILYDNASAAANAHTLKAAKYVRPQNLINNSSNWASLAKASRGTLVQTGSLMDLQQRSENIVNESEGELSQTITSAWADSLAPGAELTMTVPIAGSMIDGDVIVTAYIGDNTGASLSLVSPSGVVIDNNNAATLGIDVYNDAEEGTLSYTIPPTFNSRAGNWTATIIAPAPLVEPIDMEAGVAGKISVNTSVIGGSLEDPRPPVINVSVTQPLAIKNATVTASIYDADYTLVKNGIVLADNGVSPDQSSGDGIYSASLAGIITAVGEYEVAVKVSNEDLRAAYGTGGARIAGTDKQDVAISENFQREDAISYVLQSVGSTAQASRAIEFYNSRINHYFMTASSDEATYLDSNTNWGWTRTGKTLNIWLSQTTAPSNASPVCRFFGEFSNGTVGSHFYTVDSSECEMVKGRLDWGWGYENNAFYAVKPTANSTCPSGTSPVYRTYNNGMSGAPNHRYMANQADVSMMVSQGWLSEGTAFCGAQ